MKIKLLIIEFDYHSEVLRDLCLLCAESEFVLTIFTSEKTWNSVGLSEDIPHLEVFIKKKGLSLKDFFKQYQTVTDSNDIVLFNTCASNFKFFSRYRFNIPCVLRIHNYNSYFERTENLQFDLNSWQYDLEHLFYRSLWRRDWYYRRKFLKCINYFMFPNEVITEYARNRGRIEHKKILKSLPYTFSRSFHEIKNTEIIITVVGTVEKKRRNYDELIDALALASPSFNQPVKLVLLGKLKGNYGQKIKLKLATLSNPKLQVVTYEQFVPQATYDDIMTRSSFQIVPINLETRYQICSEKYGLTKISGAESEMIKYQLQSVFPNGYLVPEELVQLTTNYSSTADLAERIIELVNQKKSQSKNLTVFRKEIIQKQLLNICNNILKENRV
ncbi:MAG: hypothetical protein RIC35_24465 [Marinoscillum sp.]